MPSDDRAARAEIVSFLRGRVAEKIRQPTEQVLETGHLIRDYGLTSLDAVVLSGELEDRFGLELEPTTLFDLPSIGRVADAIADRVAPDRVAR